MVTCLPRTLACLAAASAAVAAAAPAPAATAAPARPAAAPTTFSYDVPLDPRSPWPKFRRTARQDGRSPVVPAPHGRRAAGPSGPARGSSARR